MNAFSEQLFSVVGKTVIVTGASRGIGLAVAEGLHQAGAYVVGISRSRPQNESYFKDYFTTDLSKPEDVLKTILVIQKKYEQIHGLVNAAGVTFPNVNLTLEESICKFDETYQVNVKSGFMFIQGLKDQLIQGKASVINVTSIAQDAGFPNNPAYVSSKGALKQLTQAFAFDLAPLGVRVNNLVPGYIHTQMTEKSFNDPTLNKERQQNMLIPRWGEPQDLLGPVIFLLSSASSYMTGSSVVVDGGWLTKGL